jgi:fermentation-respiration switch protein FrsA (DUF1100 family)
MPSWLVDMLTVLVVIAALVLIAAWLLSGRMVRRRKPDPPSSPADFGLPFEHVTFSSRDGVKLGGWLINEANTRRPTIVFCAGMFGSMDGDTQMAPHFVQAGFDVLQFDWRAHGISDGQRTTLGVRESEDLIGALDFLQSRGINHIGLMGFSMGGTVALLVTAQDRRVACMVCDGGFLHIAHTIEGAIRKSLGLPLKPFVWMVLRFAELRLGVKVAEANPFNSVGQISPRPVLFIHGGQDPHVPIADQDALFNACNEPKTLWRIDEAGHREAYKLDPDAYRQRVLSFFRQHLLA